MGCWLPGEGAVATTDSRVFSELRIDSAEQSDESASISEGEGVVFLILDGRWVDPVVLCMRKKEENKRTKLEVWGVDVEVWGVVKVGQN